MLRIINVEDTGHPVLAQPKNNATLRAEIIVLQKQVDRLADENLALLRTVKSMRVRHSG